MRALAMLSAPFYAQARLAVAPPGSVSVRSGTVEFLDAVTRGSSDVALVDPMLMERDRGIADSLLRAHLGTVLYIRLTPEYAQASVQLIRELGSGEIVTYGYNDDPTTFAGILKRQSRASRGLVLLRALAPQISRMPKALRRGVGDISEQGHRIDSVECLAALCAVTRTTLFRHFKNAGIMSVSGFVTGLTLIRNYDVLIDKSLSMLDVAKAVGLGSERSLRQRTAAVAGLSPPELRASISIEDLAARIARVLTVGRSH
ncbi:MAG: hypothetical protein ABI322_09935 [Gemmatimonadaceae bacterium]